MRNAACINVGHIVFCSGGSLKNRKPLSNTNMCVINRRNWKCSSNLKPLSQNLIAFCVRLRKENIKSRISHFVCQRQNFDSWKLKHWFKNIHIYVSKLLPGKVWWVSRVALEVHTIVKVCAEQYLVGGESGFANLLITVENLHIWCTHLTHLTRRSREWFRSITK